MQSFIFRLGIDGAHGLKGNSGRLLFTLHDLYYSNLVSKKMKIQVLKYIKIPLYM